MVLFAAATTTIIIITTTIDMTNTTGNRIGMLLAKAQQQQNANGVTIGNCVTIGDNSTIPENVRIAENTKIGENITMTSGGQTDGNASSPITSLQNATAVPVNTQINIAKAVAKPTIVLYLVMMMALLFWSASSADGFYKIRMGADWRTTTYCFDITHILRKPLLCSKFTDRKGITDTATMNFVVTNDRKRRNLG